MVATTPRFNKGMNDAIRRKVEINRIANKRNQGQNLTNKKNERDAYTQANKTKKPVTYTTSRELGAKEGFTQSDYGVGKGAGIPYQIKTDKHTARPGPRANITDPVLPGPKEKLNKAQNHIDAIRRKLNNPLPPNLPKQPRPGER